MGKKINTRHAEVCCCKSLP